jgi:pentatricopeptide repeat protein
MLSRISRTLSGSCRRHDVHDGLRLAAARSFSHSSSVSQSTSVHAEAHKTAQPSPRRARTHAPVTAPSSPSPAGPSAQNAEERRLLLPYALSRRLLKLTQEGKLDEAIEVLQTSPNDAKNIKVWNTMIQQCMNARRYKQAFRLYTDVSSRSSLPQVCTYSCHSS